MRLGIVGAGIVGKATARAFLEHVDSVMVYDVVRERATHSLREVLECDLIFICLPTPQKEGSLECDTSVIEIFFTQIRLELIYPGRDELPVACNFVLRSTVPVGFTRQMASKYKLTNLVHSPEFLTARCAITDAQLPARNIIGYTGDVPDPWVQKGPLADLYERRFPDVPLVLCTSDESEFVKLFCNGFATTKVVFFSAMHAFAEKAGMNWDVVRAAVLSGGMIHPTHTLVPGPSGQIGARGHCLRKDTANLASCMEAGGISTDLLQVVLETNDRLIASDGLSA